MAVPFDPQRLTVTGAPVPVVEGVVQSLDTGSAQYSVSATGSLVYVPGGLMRAQRTVGVGRSTRVWSRRYPRRLAAICIRGSLPMDSAAAVTVRKNRNLQHLGVRPRPRQLGPADVPRERQLHGRMDARRQAGRVRLNEEGPYEPILAIGRRQWRPGAAGKQRVRPESSLLVPRRATAGVH